MLDGLLQENIWFSSGFDSFELVLSKASENYTLEAWAFSGCGPGQAGLQWGELGQAVGPAQLQCPQYEDGTYVCQPKTAELHGDKA